MPITQLDPRTALVVIDLQEGLRAYPTLRPLDEIVGHARTLAAAFRQHALPVVLVNAAGRPAGRTDQPRRVVDPPAGWTDLMPELDPQPHDLRLTKTAPGAFGDSALAAELRSRRVTQVVIVGVSTSQGVEATARQAYDLGFHVTLPLDAMTDLGAAQHAFSTTHVFPRIAETGAVADVLALLSTRGVS